MRQVHDGFDKMAPAFVAMQIADEGAVDLQCVDGQAVQIGQRRIAGAEVVQQQQNAHRFQLLEQIDRVIGFFHHHAFGDLEFQFRRIETAGSQGFLHVA